MYFLGPYIHPEHLANLMRIRYKAAIGLMLLQAQAQMAKSHEHKVNAKSAWMRQ
jgi:hypothetical protein